MNQISAPTSGFSNPVLSSQIVFRLVLEAMSRPGVISRLPDLGLEVPDGMSPAAAAILLTLADHETSVWLAPDFDRSCHDWLRFYCGTPIARGPAHAVFGLMNGKGASPALNEFALGEDCYPEKSSTVIVQCGALTGGVPFILSGPGLESTQTIAPSGLRPGFQSELKKNHELFPRGVDIVLATGSDLICLPRSASVLSPKGDA